MDPRFKTFGKLITPIWEELLDYNDYAWELYDTTPSLKISQNRKKGKNCRKNF